MQDKNKHDYHAVTIISHHKMHNKINNAKKFYPILAACEAHIEN